IPLYSGLPCQNECTFFSWRDCWCTRSFLYWSQQTHTPGPSMPTHLKRAARFRAHAVTCLTSAEAAPDEKTRRAHLAVAKHFYLLAEQEISQRETKQR